MKLRPFLGGEACLAEVQTDKTGAVAAKVLP